jgi:hypothetical protein
MYGLGDVSQTHLVTLFCRYVGSNPLLTAARAELRFFQPLQKETVLLVNVRKNCRS